MRKRNTVKGTLLPALFCLFAASLRADFPAATYSLACDGDVTTASSFLGGSALTFSYSSPGTGDYLAIRDSETDKAFVTTDSIQPWSQNLDVLGQGQWSMLVVARGADVANGVYWDVGWCAYQETDPAGWCTGFCLIRTASGETALVRRLKGASPQTILSARVDNDSIKFHSYLQFLFSLLWQPQPYLRRIAYKSE